MKDYKKPTHKSFQDIEGQQFNSWTVGSFAYRINKTSYYNCTCVCGNDKVIAKSNLTSGASKSCGCQVSRRNYEAAHEMIGETFGYLKILEIDEELTNTSRVETYLSTECVLCGVISSKPKHNILQGKIKSCGSRACKAAVRRDSLKAQSDPK